MRFYVKITSIFNIQLSITPSTRIAVRILRHYDVVVAEDYKHRTWRKRRYKINHRYRVLCLLIQK